MRKEMSPEDDQTINRRPHMAFCKRPLLTKSSIFILSLVGVSVAAVLITDLLRRRRSCLRQIQFGRWAQWSALRSDISYC
jgi:hypothetical protein